MHGYLADESRQVQAGENRAGTLHSFVSPLCMTDCSLNHYSLVPNTSEILDTALFLHIDACLPQGGSLKLLMFFIAHRPIYNTVLWPNKIVPSKITKTTRKTKRKG